MVGTWMCDHQGIPHAVGTTRLATTPRPGFLKLGDCECLIERFAQKIRHNSQGAKVSVVPAYDVYTFWVLPIKVYLLV
jgi:hypothetical protein